MHQISAEVWDRLYAAATTVRRSAYAPYSHYPVGAAAQTVDGRIVTGCNIENASYGLGLCAECSLISDLYRTGGGRLVAFMCVDERDKVLVPCGRCRQLLFEHGGPNLMIYMPAGPQPLSRVLPDAFGPDHLFDTAEESHAD